MSCLYTVTKRGAENVKARKNTKVFWLILSTKIENIWKQYLTKNLNHQHFVHFHISSSFNSPHNGIPCLMRFPHQYPPPRPQLLLFSASTAAFASRSRWTTESWPFSDAMCSGVSPRERQPEAKPQAEPNLWEKLWENFGHLKSRSFGNCGRSKILSGLKEQCGFEMFWWHRVGWKKLLPLDFWQGAKTSWSGFSVFETVAEEVEWAWVASAC